MTDYAEVHDKLKKSLPELPRTLQFVASYMLDHPGEIATAPMRQVARNAGVAIPNFDRLAKHMGFGTYSELREIFKHRVQDEDKGDYHRRAERLQRTAEQEGDVNLHREFHRAAMSCVDRIYGTIKPETLVEIVVALENCPKINVIGAQGSRSFATYLNYIGGMASPQFCIPERDGGLIADELIDVASDEAFIIISTQPCAKSAIDVAKFAHETGCLVVGIGDSHASPLALYADHLLITPTDGPMFFGSYIGNIAIIELLVGFMASRKNGNTVNRIEKIEQNRVRFGEYWNSKEQR